MDVGGFMKKRNELNHAIGLKISLDSVEYVPIDEYIKLRDVVGRLICEVENSLNGLGMTDSLRELLNDAYDAMPARYRVISVLNNEVVNRKTYIKHLNDLYLKQLNIGECNKEA